MCTYIVVIYLKLRFPIFFHTCLLNCPVSLIIKTGFSYRQNKMVTSSPLFSHNSFRPCRPDSWCLVVTLLEAIKTKSVCPYTTLFLFFCLFVFVELLVNKCAWNGVHGGARVQSVTGDKHKLKAKRQQIDNVQHKHGETRPCRTELSISIACPKTS